MYHYVIVRADLPLGVQLAQTIHAAGESSPGSLPPHTHAIALHAATEAELIELEMRLGENGFKFNSIREPDEPWNGQLMAIGIEPQLRTTALSKLLRIDGVALAK